MAALQQALQAAGFSPGAIDGSFGLGTEAAVLAFQRSKGLAADGVVGPNTATALGLLPYHGSIRDSGCYCPSRLSDVSCDADREYQDKSDASAGCLGRVMARPPVSSP